jgi:phosphoglucomutase
MSGAQEIEQMMVKLRENPPQDIAGATLIRSIDYKESVDRDLVKGTEKTIDYPKSNVLQFFTSDGSKISARPSGTEPKIKFYFSVHDQLKDKADFDKVDAMLDQRIESIIWDLGVE